MASKRGMKRKLEEEPLPEHIMHRGPISIELHREMSRIMKNWWMARDFTKYEHDPVTGENLKQGEPPRPLFQDSRDILVPTLQNKQKRGTQSVARGTDTILDVNESAWELPAELSVTEQAKRFNQRDRTAVLHQRNQVKRLKLMAENEKTDQNDQMTGKDQRRRNGQIYMKGLTSQTNRMDQIGPMETSIPMALTGQIGQTNQVGKGSQMNPMNQRGHAYQLNPIEPTGQEKRVGQVDSMAQRIQTSQMNSPDQRHPVVPIVPVGRMNLVGQLSPVGQIERTNQANRLNEGHQTVPVDPASQTYQMTYSYQAMLMEEIRPDLFCMRGFDRNDPVNLLSMGDQEKVARYLMSMKHLEKMDPSSQVVEPGQGEDGMLQANWDGQKEDEATSRAKDFEPQEVEELNKILADFRAAQDPSYLSISSLLVDGHDS